MQGLVGDLGNIQENHLMLPQPQPKLSSRPGVNTEALAGLGGT